MNTAPPAIATPRLHLLAYSGGYISDVKLDPQLEEELASLLRVVPFAEAVAGWGPWLVLEQSSGEAAGSAGFKGAPRADTVEIGYGISTRARRKGYAAEATKALVDWGFGHDQVERVVAECEPANEASVKLLTRLGMNLRAREEGMLRWELTASSWRA
ncbi:MAG: GNAT family N-acetyltransferase [Actinomycetota bacterium]